MFVVDPIFWLGLSILLVAVSLAMVLVALVPAVQEIARAARSLEKLSDTLRRELPPTLEAIRLTGMEITDLTDDVSQGVKSAGHAIEDVNRSIDDVRRQTQKAQTTTRSLVVGMKAAWKSFTRKPKPMPPRSTSGALRPSNRPADLAPEMPPDRTVDRPLEWTDPRDRQTTEPESTHARDRESGRGSKPMPDPQETY